MPSCLVITCSAPTTARSRSRATPLRAPFRAGREVSCIPGAAIPNPPQGKSGFSSTLLVRVCRVACAGFRGAVMVQHLVQVAIERRQGQIALREEGPAPGVVERLLLGKVREEKREALERPAQPGWRDATGDG